VLRKMADREGTHPKIGDDDVKGDIDDKSPDNN
jgi:hypothetical protein